MGLAWRSLVTPCFSFFLFFSLTFFFRLIPWSIEAPCVHLSTWVSKTWTGRRSASSLPRETGKAPVASVNRANLSRSFIGFLCKPRNISLFLSSIFLCTIFFPYLSLNQLPTPFFLQVPLDPVGAGPWHHSSILAWKIPWTEEPGGLRSMGSQRVRDDLVIKQQYPYSGILFSNKKEGGYDSYYDIGCQGPAPTGSRGTWRKNGVGRWFRER